MKRVTPLIPFTILFLAAGVAHAGRVETRAELETLLDDQIEIEDFESISIAGGTIEELPNPLSSESFPVTGVVPGVTYTGTPGPLRLFGGLTNVMQTNGMLEIAFEEPQVAVGLDLINGTGNAEFGEDVVVMSGDQVLGSFSLVVPHGSSRFIGWLDTRVGVTSFRITGTTFTPGLNGPVQIDDVAFGLPLFGGDFCPGDCEGSGDVDFEDLVCILFEFGSTNAGAGSDCDLSGSVDFNDLICTLFSFGPCP